MSDFACTKLRRSRRPPRSTTRVPYTEGLADGVQGELRGGGRHGHGGRGDQQRRHRLQAAPDEASRRATRTSLYFPDFNPACALIAKQAAEIRLGTPPLIGSDGCLATTSSRLAGAAANGVFASSPDLSAFSNGDFYKNEFLPAYKTEFGTDPTVGVPRARVRRHEHPVRGDQERGDRERRRLAHRSPVRRCATRSSRRAAGRASPARSRATTTVTAPPIVTIGVFEAPGWPVEGGSGNTDPVFRETKTLDDVL